MGRSRRRTRWRRRSSSSSRNTNDSGNHNHMNNNKWWQDSLDAPKLQTRLVSCRQLKAGLEQMSCYDVNGKAYHRLPAQALQEIPKNECFEKPWRTNTSAPQNPRFKFTHALKSLHIGSLMPHCSLENRKPCSLSCIIVSSFQEDPKLFLTPHQLQTQQLVH